MRVVIDTNVLISGLLFGGVPRQVFQACVRGETRLLTSDALLTELAGVLSRPRFGLSALAVRAMIGEVASAAEAVTVPTEVIAIVEDPPDNEVLACAVDGGADHVVSGDGHLLELGIYQSIPILTARQYLDTVLKAEA